MKNIPDEMLNTEPLSKFTSKTKSCLVGKPVNSIEELNQELLLYIFLDFV